MTHVVTDKCIKCKYTDCVEVCPVDCFYESDLMLAINPEECIDCGICVAECPIEAIVPESIDLTPWVTINKSIAERGLNINKKKNPLPDAERYANETNKYQKYFLNYKNN